MKWTFYQEAGQICPVSSKTHLENLCKNIEVMYSNIYICSKA